MSKNSTYFFIFVFGVLLAFLVCSFGSMMTSSGTSSADVQDTSEEFVTAKSGDVLENKGPLEKPKQNSKRKEDLQKRVASEKARLAVLKATIAEGKLESLQLLRKEYLNSLPSYREKILPVLKAQALHSLRKRFSEQDWQDWPKSDYAKNGGPTAARLFVDDVASVNLDLGKFLETAGHLFHGMYSSIFAGRIYDLEEDLYYLLENAERILDKGRSAAVPARMFLDSGIVSDPVFLGQMEQVLGELVIAYAKKYPEKIDTQFLLIQQLNPAESSAEVYQLIRALIYRLALDASMSYREGIFKHFEKSKTLSQFVAKDSQLQMALAELYVIGAVDALEIDDHKKAAVLLKRSQKIKTGLKAQDVVRNFLENSVGESVGEVEIPEEEVEVEVKENVSVFDGIEDSTLLDTGAGIQRLIVYLLLGAALVLGGGRVFLYLWAHGSTRGGGDVSTTQTSTTETGVSITPPSDIGFDDKSDFDAVNL